MGAPRFLPHPEVPAGHYDVLPSGWLWKLTVFEGTSARFYVADGPDLVGRSNAGHVVPNDPALFVQRPAPGGRREVEVLGLSAGNAIVEFRRGGAGPVVIHLQVVVAPLPGDRMTYVALEGAGHALNSPDFPNTYRLGRTDTVRHTHPERLFADVRPGTRHVGLCTHGRMEDRGRPGISLYVAGIVTRGNVRDAFGPLGATCRGAVIWIGGCEVAADNDFCFHAASASGCWLVAPSMQLPNVRPAPGHVEWYAVSKGKFYDPTGALVPRDEFLRQRAKLGFRLVPPA